MGCGARCGAAGGVAGGMTGGVRADAWERVALGNAARQRAGRRGGRGAPLIILGRPGRMKQTTHVPTRPTISFSLTMNGTGWPQIIAAIVLPPYEFSVSSTSPWTKRIFGEALRTAAQLPAQ